MKRLCTAALALAVVATAPAAAAEGPNGFDLSSATVPAESIIGGGPKRDGIPGVDEPVYAAPADATWVAPNNPVIGVSVGTEARSYPIHLMERHQLVNDSVAGVPLVVTFDPLTNAPRAYERKVGDQTLAFGVSGLIYNHGFLLYDRETESLWVQYTGEAIAGPLAGKRLSSRPVRHETAGAWAARHAGTRVLARPLPDRIDYSRSPYLDYVTDHRMLFPLTATDDRFHPKEVVLVLVKGDETRAYLGSVMTAAGGGIEDTFAAERVRIAYDGEESVFTWEVPEGIRVEEAFWFSVAAFRPGVKVYSP